MSVWKLARQQEKTFRAARLLYFNGSGVKTVATNVFNLSPNEVTVFSNLITDKM